VYAAAHIANEQELLAAGIISEPATNTATTPPAKIKVKRITRLPEYLQVLTAVPTIQSGVRSGQPDTSKADFRWSYIAMEWGWSASEVIRELPRVSEKACVKGTRYIEKTVDSAARQLRRKGDGGF